MLGTDKILLSVNQNGIQIGVLFRRDKRSCNAVIMHIQIIAKLMH